MRACYLGAILDVLLADPAAFGGPDVLGEPVLKAHVVGKPAEQGHGGVAVHVDEARNEDVVVLDGVVSLALVPVARLLRGQDVVDLACSPPNMIDQQVSFDR